jgi:hypothetical protein
MATLFELLTVQSISDHITANFGLYMLPDKATGYNKFNQSTLWGLPDNRSVIKLNNVFAEDWSLTNRQGRLLDKVKGRIWFLHEFLFSLSYRTKGTRLRREIEREREREREGGGKEDIEANGYTQPEYNISSVSSSAVNRLCPDLNKSICSVSLYVLHCLNLLAKSTIGHLAQSTGKAALWTCTE